MYSVVRGTFEDGMDLGMPFRLRSRRDEERRGTETNWIGNIVLPKHLHSFMGIFNLEVGASFAHCYFDTATCWSKYISSQGSCTLKKVFEALLLRNCAVNDCHKEKHWGKESLMGIVTRLSCSLSFFMHLDVVIGDSRMLVNFARPRSGLISNPSFGEERMLESSFPSSLACLLAVSRLSRTRSSKRDREVSIVFQKSTGRDRANK